MTKAYRAVNFCGLERKPSVLEQGIVHLCRSSVREGNLNVWGGEGPREGVRYIHSPVPIRKAEFIRGFFICGS